MKLALIVAMSENNVIGINNKLPWHLPEDLRYFKHITLGKPIILGRKTYDSIGKPLPGRTNIVVSRRADLEISGCKVVGSLDEAIELAEAQTLVDGAEEALVIGGAEIYRQALPRCERIYLTRVHATIDGDAYFPELDLQAWREIGREDFTAVEPNPFDYSFIVYERAD